MTANVWRGIVVALLGLLNGALLSQHPGTGTLVCLMAGVSVCGSFIAVLSHSFRK